MQTHAIRLQFALALVLLAVVGCSESARPILLCPAGCTESSGDWETLRDCLFKQEGRYWLTTTNNQPIESFRFGHEGGVLPLPTSKETPEHISTPILLRRGTKTALLHLKHPGEEQTILIDFTKLERRGKFYVLPIR
jgi:hypothetical protein